jgi:hypothetical protein
MLRRLSFAQQGLLQARSRRECYLPLPLLLSLRLPGLSFPPARSLCALPSRLSGRPGGSARWLPEESLPSPEPAARDGGGWLVGGLAARAAPRPGPGAATAVLVWASSAIRPRAVPMRAPTSAPATTRNWPRRRSDRSTGPPSSNRTLKTLPKPTEAKRRQLDLDLPADQPAVTWAPVSRPGDVQVAKVGEERTSPNPARGGIAATARAGRHPCRGGAASTL